jgi:ferredoxin-type protein NapF
MSKLQRIDKSRRGFFSGALLTSEGRNRVGKSIIPLGLAPPGLYNTISEENCSTCTGYCASSCPQKIIKLHPSSHECVGQPYLDFSASGCTFCMQCNEQCPIESDRLLQEADQCAQIGKARINNHCLSLNDVICMSCLRACPDKLFKFDQYRHVSLLSQSCSGCGMCVKSCPVEAIEVRS